MSLNGLDHVAVTQAYQGALAEAGGWFLLKYSARDAVEVLTRGSGGAAEARAAVAQYPDQSPLYGFMLYRRRKVLIRYVPEGTSRLLQVRVAVHFLTVAEKFAPHDIALSITTPEELSEAALASACALHTAAPSSSASSASSRHQKLSWIQEAAEEGSNTGAQDSSTLPRLATTTATTTATSTAPSTAPSTATSTAVLPTVKEPPATIDEEPMRNVSVTSDSAISVPLILEEKHIQSNFSGLSTSPVPETTPVVEEAAALVPQTPESDLTDLQATLSSYEQLFENAPEPRASSQTARPNYDDLYEHYYAQYSKPKVKLGPRPRPSLEGHRPSTSSSGTQSVSRPKSSLPAGLRSATKKAAEARVEMLKDISLVPALALPSPPPVPKTPEVPSSPISLSFTARSPASVRSMPVSAYSSHYRSTGMTQERTRLMKALELRKKQQKAQVERQEKLAVEAAAKSAAEAEAESSSQGQPEKGMEAEAVPKVEVEEKIQDTAEKKSSNGEQKSCEDEVSSSSGLVNSSLGFSSSLADSDDLNSAASVSSPISAQTQGSSGAPSTRPSSMSEDGITNAEPTAKHDPTVAVESPDMLDEEQSVDSQPTIVPESRTPIPSLVHPSSQSGASPAALSPEFLARASDEDLSVSALPSVEDDKKERRRSKRQSMLIVPSDNDSSVHDKWRNRESVIMPSSKRQSWYETKERRRAMLEPLQVSAENSEAEYLSDDSFMEELQTATVYQAKPISVSKSPITPWFPRKASDNDMVISGRSAYAVSLRSSNEHLQRKTSGPWPPQFNNEQPIVAKKINVSSGISQRIKALAEKSIRDSSPPSSSHGTLETPSSTLAQRKSSFFAASPLETSPNERSAARLGSPAFLGSSTPTPDRQALHVKPIKATVYNVQRANQKPESVQVTARIVRDQRVMKPALAMPTETTPLDLHQSPLIINHNKPSWTPKSPTRGRPEPASPMSMKAPSTSHSHDQSNGPSNRTSLESPWKSLGRRMSESKSIHSHETEDKRDEKKDKKESRTSKMFKRMSSSMSSMPWKNSSNNLTLPENHLRSTSLASLREPPPPVHVGDLNVQFPDTLLWKRRYVEIDSAGNLVLSPSRSNEKGVIKRFHLTDFRTPYPPDQDRQELPNSVVLDFVDGRTLQVACETYTAQAQVLQILREAHDAWLAYNQSV